MPSHGKAHVSGHTILHMISESSWVPMKPQVLVGVLIQQVLSLVAIYPGLGLSLETIHSCGGGGCPEALGAKR